MAHWHSLFQCLMPETLTPQTEGVSEEALKERICLRRVKESVDLFDQLMQAGMYPPADSVVELHLNSAQNISVAGTGYGDDFLAVCVAFHNWLWSIQVIVQKYWALRSTTCLPCHFGGRWFPYWRADSTVLSFFSPRAEL